MKLVIKKTRPDSCVILASRDHSLTEGLRSRLETIFEVVVMVADEVSLVECACRLNPALVLVHLTLSGSGFSWLRTLRTLCPGLKIIVLSQRDESGLRPALIRCGAGGFLLNSALDSDLLPAIDAVLSGGLWPSV